MPSLPPPPRPSLPAPSTSSPPSASPSSSSAQGRRASALLAASGWILLCCLLFYQTGEEELRDALDYGRAPRRFYYDEGDVRNKVRVDGDSNKSDDSAAAAAAAAAASAGSSSGNVSDFAALKKILFFNNYFDIDDYEFGFGQEAFISHGCAVSNCLATKNRSLLGSIAEFDALLFHLIDMRKGNRFVVPNQKRRRSSQRYVMFLMEAPETPENFPYKPLAGFFNWTMTYRLDSDVPRPYGWIEPQGERRTVPPRDSDGAGWIDFNEADFAKSLESRDEEFKSLALKPKLVAWIVSNCETRSDREGYVRELRKYVGVDIMGGCGSRPCDQHHRSRSDNCSAAVDNDYKFYLSFENSLCDQYVTEKFWRRMGEPVVPIVMGRGRYAKVAPPHSYLNVEDFSSPKALAEHLLFLDQNPAAYLSYFWWRDHYRAVNSREQKAASMCELCRMLNDPSEPTKVVHDLEEWWWRGGRCLARGKAPWSSAWSGSWIGQQFLGGRGKI